MRTKPVLLAVALCSVILSAQFPWARSLHLAEDYTAHETNAPNVREFKVHMDSRSLWSTGSTSQAKMVSAAQNASYQVVFFADDVQFFAPTAFLSNGDFEETNASGAPLGWALATLSREGQNIIATSEVFHRPTLPPNANFWQNHTYQIEIHFVRSGNSSLHLAVQNTSNSSMEGGYAYATSTFQRPSLNQSSTLRPLLASGVNFSGYVYIDKLGMDGVPLKVAIHQGLGYAIGVDNGWFYVRFTLDSPRHPYGLNVTLVYEDHPIDQDFLKNKSSLNQTNEKVIFLGVPPLDEWLHVNANVTDLAVRLWNETITDWRLKTIEVGTRSRNNLLTSAYVDDVSLSAPNPLDYFKSDIEGKLSSNNFAAYPAYSINFPNQPSLLVYGTDYIPQNLPYTLMDPAVWQSIGDTVAMQNGMVVLGPVNTVGLGTYIAQNGGFGVNIMDGTSLHGLVTAGQVLDQGRPIFFGATAEASSPTDYASDNTWAMHVFAENDSQAAILQAIAQGKAYVAVSNFGGTFSAKGYGFPLGTSPVYVANGANASLTVSFNGLTSGRIILFDGPTIALRADHNGEASTYLTTPLSKPISHLFVAVTAGNNSISLVTNPTTFIQTSLLPGGALFMDNDRWILQSSQWTTTLTEQQRLNVAVSGPAGSDATLYLYSPEYRPDAESQDQIARFITVDNATLNPMSSYDVSKLVFVLDLHSNGKPIGIVFNFDVPLNFYLYSLLGYTLLLSLAVLTPFVVASGYLLMRRFRKRSTH